MLFPNGQVRRLIGMLGVYEDRHLMRSERALDLQTVNALRPRPAFG